jgi:uncharacterized membrane-anchored protein YhcB (DUF1043 family)
MEPLYVALVAFPLVGLAVGFLLGRRSSDGAERARTLEAELDAERAVLEQVQAEKLSALEDLGRARAEAEGYRERVVQHFYGTSDQLRSLTLRYRELFEHLADGARDLCPEAVGALQAGLEAPALGSGAAEAEARPESESEAPVEPLPAPEGEVSKAQGQTPF